MRFEVMEVIGMKIRVFWTDAASTGTSLLTRRSFVLPSYSGCSRLGLPAWQKGNNLLWDVVNCLYQSARGYIPECMNNLMLTFESPFLFDILEIAKYGSGLWAFSSTGHNGTHSALNVLSAALPQCWYLRKVAYWPDGCFYFVHLFPTASMQLA